jgi:hypothetical protein
VTSAPTIQGLTEERLLAALRAAPEPLRIHQVVRAAGPTLTRAERAVAVRVATQILHRMKLRRLVFVRKVEGHRVWGAAIVAGG